MRFMQKNPKLKDLKKKQQRHRKSKGNSDSADDSSEKSPKTSGLTTPRMSNNEVG
jgi:hypothetical protein